jgi:hypothetical protein
MDIAGAACGVADISPLWCLTRSGDWLLVYAEALCGNTQAIDGQLT